MNTVPRAASLPLGIALVGVGAVLLFVAFHNLPSNVTNFPELIVYLAESLRGKAPAAAAGGPPASAPAGGGGFKLPGLPFTPLPPFGVI